MAFQGKKQTDHILSHALGLSFSPGSERAIDIEPRVFDCPQNKYYYFGRNEIDLRRGSMNIFLRAGAILLKPKEEWVKIKDVPTTVQQLFTQYAMILAAIPAISLFIRNGLVGYKNPFIGWQRYPLAQAILQAILYYIFTLLGVYVFGVVINALAPTFGSKQNLQNAMKLAVYSMTPMWVAGIFYIIPMPLLRFLPWLAGLYGLYVLYLGFNNPLMDTPKDKVLGYMLISFSVITVLSLVFVLLLGVILKAVGISPL